MCEYHDSKGTENYDYGEIEHDLILKLFGDELTYNELAFYARDKTATSYLKIEVIRFDAPKFNLYHNPPTQLITAYIYGKKILEKKYSIHHSCEMFIIMSEMKTRIEQEEEYETEDEETEDEETEDENQAEDSDDETDEDDETEPIHEGEEDPDDNPAEDDEPIYETDDENQAESEDKHGDALFHYFKSLGKLHENKISG